MKNRLFTLLFSFLPLLSFSADGEVNYGGLEVTWIDGNTIKVTGGTLGPGSAGSTETVITNFIGTCTNCVNISPEQLHQIKEDIISICSSGRNMFYESSELADQISEICTDALNEIGHYVYFFVDPSTSTSNINVYWSELVRQDYDYSYVHGKQAELSIEYQKRQTLSPVERKRISLGFSNGIYDYANNVDAPNYNQIKAKSLQLSSLSNGNVELLNRIQIIVEGMSEDACECTGGSCDSNGDGSGGSGGVSGDCPCLEQLEAIKNYSSSIDSNLRDLYQDLVQLKATVVSIDGCLTSFAEAFGSVFLNDSTIVVDDGANSWTNVYTQGYSALYAYNHSNVLQRIELLLYGLAWPSANSSFTNSLDVLDGSGDAQDSISSAVDDAGHSISEASQAYEDDVRSLGSSLSSLWDSFRFLGAGRLQNFALMEPTRVFDEYDLEFEFTRSADLSDLQAISRTAFQVFYLLSSLAFMIFFWFKVVRFIYEKSLFVLDFFNKALT